MQVTRKDIDALNAVITIAIDKADLSPKIDSVLTSYRKRANIPVSYTHLTLPTICSV